MSVERKSKGTGRIWMQCIPNASCESLQTAVTGNIEAGALVKTDGWKGYN